MNGGFSIPRVEIPGRKEAEKNQEAVENAEELQAIAAKNSAKGVPPANTPVWPGQYRMHGLWRHGPLQARHFMLPAQINEMNALLDETQPEDSPKIVLTGPPREYPPGPDGSIAVLIWHMRVMYVQAGAEFFEGRWNKKKKDAK